MPSSSSTTLRDSIVEARGGKPSGHKFGKRELGIVEARRRIYVPTYEWVLENRIACVDVGEVNGRIFVMSGDVEFVK